MSEATCNNKAYRLGRAVLNTTDSGQASVYREAFEGRVLKTANTHISGIARTIQLVGHYRGTLPAEIVSACNLWGHTVKTN